MPMGTRDPASRRAQAWRRLSGACADVRRLLYRKHNRKKAMKYLPHLEDLLSAVPENEMAAVRWEAHALCHELRGELAQALDYRLREIELMTMLCKHVEAQGFDEDTQQRDRDALEKRHEIVESLKRRLE